MTETGTTDEKTPAKAPTITFKGRKIEVRSPGAAQAMMWSRVERQFRRLADRSEAGEDIAMPEFRTALDRLARMVESMLASQEDKDWLEDEILDGSVVDKDLLDMFTKIGETLKAAAPAANRAARRVKPGKKRS